MPLNVEALNEVGRIFDWRPDTSRYFTSAALEQVRNGLLQELTDGHGVPVLVGEAGAGKTLLVNRVVQALPAHWVHVAQLTFTVMSGQELASSIAYALGMPAGPSVMSHQAPREWIETQLRVWASCDESSLLVVDEAQNLPVDALQTLLDLNQIRLNGRPVLRMVLVGQPDILQQLDPAELPPQWAAHATHLGPRFLLPPLTATESAAYLQHRLSQYAGPVLPTLTPLALAEIHARAQGRPGRINMLCQQLLHSSILLESYEPIDAAAVAAQADELLYHAAPNTPSAQSAAGAARAPQEPAAAPVQALPLAEPALAVHLTNAPAPGSIAKRPEDADARATLAHALPRPTSGQAQAKRFVPWSLASLTIVLVAAIAWFYVQHPTSPTTATVSPTTVKAPTTGPAASSVTVATPPVAVDPAIATENAATPDPQTQALLSAPVATPALPPSSKELPHSTPLEKKSTAAGATATPTAPKTSPAPATVNASSPPAPPKAPSPVPEPHNRQIKQQEAATPKVAPTAERSGPQTTNAQCTNLLAQMSLGEPISAKQRHVLQTQCR